ncbi:outer membrane beta-barrel protein [Lacinutrix iliipiscaria]|uniref:Outer membrane beta-barrel protein n=1 Tax=Lacinutrix iliipiscaria TaxID=1230532 RepID=A0ABW5WJP3_9FLAO
MNTSFKTFKFASTILLIVVCYFSGYSQSETSTWKAQFAVGINSPSQNAFVTPFEAKPVNFPTFNIGLQRMLSKSLGVKLDFGYNRFSNASNSPDFKVNYSRINAQAVYDPSDMINFLPPRISVIAHGGPGFTFVKPLGNYVDYNTSFLNAMVGLEVHYGISQTLSLYFDTSYIYSFGRTHDSLGDGFYNGNLLTATVGISISLSGCYYCE